MTTGYRIRYAVIDTSTLDPGEPTAAELDRFYRGHLADYTQFDRRTGSVIEKPDGRARRARTRSWSSWQEKSAGISLALESAQVPGPNSDRRYAAWLLLVRQSRLRRKQ